MAVFWLIWSLSMSLGGVKWNGCVLVDLVIKYATWRL